MNDALGLIEIKGLAGAITIADTMVKTANVTLLGIEKAKGFGWITIKVVGDVGAVTASVSTGKALAEQYDQFVSAKVIPRPSQGVGKMFCTPADDTINRDSEVPPATETEGNPPLQEENQPTEDLLQLQVNSVQEEAVVEPLPQQDSFEETQQVETDTLPVEEQPHKAQDALPLQPEAPVVQAEEEQLQLSSPPMAEQPARKKSRGSRAGRPPKNKRAETTGAEEEGR